MCGNLGKICANLCKIAVCAFIYFTKMAPKMKLKTFFWRLCLFSGKLGEDWASLGEIWAKMMLDVPCAQ